MKVIELSAAAVGKPVRVWDGDRELSGRLDTVSFAWEPDDEVWGGSVKVLAAQLSIGGWDIEVGPEACVEFLDWDAFTHRLSDDLESASN